MRTEDHTRRVDADGVTIVTPTATKFNAMAPTMIEVVAQAVDDLTRRDDPRALV